MTFSRPRPTTPNLSPPATVRRSLRLDNRLPVVLFGFLLLVQIFNPARIFVALILGLGTMLLFSYLWAREMRDGLVARRLLSGAWVLVGDVLVETFTVENSSILPVLWAEIIDHSDLPGYRPDWVTAMNGGQTQRYKTKGRCQRRGVFRLGPWELRTGDPLGIFSVVHTFADSRSLLVYPRAMHLPDLQLPRGEAAGRARTSRRTPQFTTSAASIRPYIPGDSLRRVHWRQTARHDALMVKQFDLEPSGDLWLVLDLDSRVQAGQGIESTVEYGVTLAASLAVQMLADNRRVGLAAFGQHSALLPPQSGELQLWRILEALAHAEAAPVAPFSRVLRDLRENVGRGRTVVAITPAADPDWPAELLHLARRGNAPAAILLDAASFRPQPSDAASDPLAGLRAVLAEQAVPAHVIDRSFIFRPLQRIRRTRTELRTLSATGRVIAVEVEELV